jgi:hypothetical protein
MKSALKECQEGSMCRIKLTVPMPPQNLTKLQLVRESERGDIDMEILGGKK